MFDFTNDGVLHHVNSTLLNELGYTKAELIGQQVNEILAVPTKVFLQTRWLTILKLDGFANELYLTLRTKDRKSLPVIINSCQTICNGIIYNQCVAMVARNRHQYEEEFKKAKAAYETALLANTALKKSQKELQQITSELNLSINRLKLQNQELREVNKVVSHDLQEPIRKLLFYTEQFPQSSAVAMPPRISDAERVHRIAGRLQQILGGLQRYIWLTETDLPVSEVDLDQILEKAIADIIKRYADIPIRFETNRLHSARGNEELIGIMLHELLDNAVQFRKKDEPLLIQVFGTLVEENRLKHLANRFQYRKYIRITITDNGVGLPPGVGEEIFKLLFRSSNSTGVGAGLAIARKVSEYLEGSIFANTEPGAGTTFTITLPLYDSSNDEENTAH